MSKKHWNTVTIDGDVPEDELKTMIDNSYALV
jgi:predicted DNA-binding protein (MmcQ/YjbR family)